MCEDRTRRSADDIASIGADILRMSKNIAKNIAKNVAMNRGDSLQRSP
jgi:hypothetical protein